MTRTRTDIHLRRRHHSREFRVALARMVVVIIGSVWYLAGDRSRGGDIFMLACWVIIIGVAWWHYHHYHNVS